MISAAPTQFLDSELTRFLRSLPEHQLRKLETLVYFGRDSSDVHGNDIRWLHQHIKGTSRTVVDARRTIREKIQALSTYLPQAVREAEELGIDIDGSFE